MLASTYSKLTIEALEQGEIGSVLTIKAPEWCLGQVQIYKICSNVHTIQMQSSRGVL